MFCSPGGVCGIQTNGDRSRRYGIDYDPTLSVTFYFSREERIESIWIMTRPDRGDKHLGPFFIVSFACTASIKRAIFDNYRSPLPLVAAYTMEFTFASTFAAE